MSSFDSVLEFLEPTEEGLADLFKKKAKKASFSSVTIESPIGPLHTINQRNEESKPYLLETTDPITFKVFGKEFSNVIRLNNVGTNESPKFDQKEVNSIKKAIQILPGKSNQIQKAVYEYHSQFEDELFGEYDYDDNKGFSPSVNQMKTVQGCVNYFDQIKLDLYLLYDNKPVVYLDMYNADYFKFNSEGGIVCTILPKIVVDDWEGYPFEEAEE